MYCYYYEVNLRKIRKKTISIDDFIRLTGVSKSRLYEIERGTTYIYHHEIITIAKLLQTTPAIISEGLLVWEKNRPLPFHKNTTTTIDLVAQNENIESFLKEKDLHPKQEDIINFIRNYPKRYPPSVREIGAGVNLKSSSTVHKTLTGLVDKGIIERKDESLKCKILTKNKHKENINTTIITTPTAHNTVDIESKIVKPIVKISNEEQNLTVEDLKSEIECQRQKMHVIALEKGISHPDILKISRSINELVNILYTRTNK